MNAALQKSLTGKTPEETIAVLNRANAAQNVGVDALPGLTQTVQNLSDRSAAFGAAASSTAEVLGDIAGRLKTSADATIEALEAKLKQNGKLSTEDQAALDSARWQSDAWGEGGNARVLVHGVTQGVLSWLGGDGSVETGLKGGGGAMLSAKLGPILTEKAYKLLRDAGFENNQQTAALASLIGEVVTTGVSSAAFGNEGGATAASVDINNRELHQGEPEVIKRLAEGDPEKEERLIAAACYLTRCADGVPKNDLQYAMLKARQDYGATLTEEIAELQVAFYEITERVYDEVLGDQGEVTYSRRAFTYTPEDYVKDSCSSSGEFCVRLVGGVEMVAGGAGVVTSVSAGIASCPETLGAGCVGAVVGGLTSLDYYLTGYQQLVSGKPATPYGVQVLESYKISSETAHLIYGTANIAGLMESSAVLMTRNILGKMTFVEAGAEAEMFGAADDLAAWERQITGKGSIPNRGATISSPLADGQPGAIYKGFGDLNKRQQGLLDQLGSPGQTTIIPKNGISQKDVASLTAKTGDEFAVFTVGGRRMVVRGWSNGFDGIINEAWAAEKAAQGWRFSAHTHPVPNGVEPGAVLRSSGGDQAILNLFPNNRSAILNSTGGRTLFTPNGDSLQGWLPD